MPSKLGEKSAKKINLGLPEMQSTNVVASLLEFWGEINLQSFWHKTNKLLAISPLFIKVGLFGSNLLDLYGLGM